MSFSYQFRIPKFRLEWIKYLPESVLADYLCPWVNQCYTVNSNQFEQILSAMVKLKATEVNLRQTHG